MPGCIVMRNYIELTKPRITWLILMSTGVGYFFGLKRAFFNPVTGAAIVLARLPGARPGRSRSFAASERKNKIRIGD